MYDAHRCSQQKVLRRSLRGLIAQNASSGMKLKGRDELLDRLDVDGVETGVEAAVVDGVRLGVARDSCASDRWMASRSSPVSSSSWIWSTRRA